MRVVVTGQPGCSYCTMLEKIVAKVTTEYEKVDIQAEGNEKYLEIVKEDGCKMPAQILVFGSNVCVDKYVVSATSPAKVPNVKEFLEKNLCV